MLLKASSSLRPLALGSTSGWYIVTPIREVRVRARLDLVASLFECFLRGVATCLGNFVVPAGLRVRQFSSPSIVADPSRGL
jgi:hypothetical protein